MKAKHLFMLVTSVFMLCNCTQDEETPQTIQRNIKTLTASIESSSRSTVTDKGEFSWTIGDAISVWNDKNWVIYTCTSGNSFSTTDEAPGTPTGYAIYPANNNHGINGTTVTLNLPATYGNIDTEYTANTQAPMLAVIEENNNLSFSHLGGVMRFFVKDVPTGITSFCFETDKAITGPFSVIEENGKIIKAGNDPTDKNKVTLNFKATTSKSDMVFYIPLPVGTYGNYTVTVGDQSHESVNVSNTIQRAGLLLMPTFTYTETKLEKGNTGTVVMKEGDEVSMTVASGTDVAINMVSGATAVLDLQATDDTQQIGITDGSDSNTESATTSNGTLNITTDIPELNINTPTLTVNLASGNYTNITALTAQQTLVISQGVKVENLAIKGGNVRVYGEVTNIIRTQDNHDAVTYVFVEEGASVPTDVSDENIKIGYTKWNGNKSTEPVIDNTNKHITIAFASDLAWLAEQVNAKNTLAGYTVKLISDIDLGNYQWTPIGHRETFEGLFDGTDHIISNLYYHFSGDDYFVGLFGCLSNATIQNLKIKNVDILLDGAETYGHIGSVAGWVEGTSYLKNITIEGKVEIEGEMIQYASHRIGGIVGGNQGGTVTFTDIVVNADENSFVKGNSYVGGMAGQLQGVASFENCSTNINVSAYQYFAGGIIGIAPANAKFNKCQTSGNISVTNGREGNANDLYRVGSIAGGWDDNITHTLMLTDCSSTCTLAGQSTDGTKATTFDNEGYVGRGYSTQVGAKVSVNGTTYVYGTMEQ